MVVAHFLNWFVWSHPRFVFISHSIMLLGCYEVLHFGRIRNSICIIGFCFVLSCFFKLTMLIIVIRITLGFHRNLSQELHYFSSKNFVCLLDILTSWSSFCNPESNQLRLNHSELVILKQNRNVLICSVWHKWSTFYVWSGSNVDLMSVQICIMTCSHYSTALTTAWKVQ